MNYRITVLRMFTVVVICTCISMTSAARPTLKSVLSDLAAGGRRLCPYCGLCSYVNFCNSYCLQQPTMSCFLCQFQGHCKTTCVNTCKSPDPCSPNPCNRGETCEETPNGKYRCLNKVGHPDCNYDSSEEGRKCFI